MNPGRRTPIGTAALVLLLCLVFGLEFLWGGPSYTPTLARMGAEIPGRIRDGEWFRLLAATQLHSGALHLFMNLWVLATLGLFLEPALGTSRLLVLYVVSGLGGSLLGTLLSELTGAFGMSVGASGALAGLLSATVLSVWWPAARGKLVRPLPGSLKPVAAINLVILVGSSLNEGVDYLAHLGGAVAGLLCALGFFVGRLPAAVRRGAAAIAMTLLVGSLVIGCERGQPYLLTDAKLEARIEVPLPALELRMPLPRVLLPLSGGPARDGVLERHFGEVLASPCVGSLVVRRLVEGPGADVAGAGIEEATQAALRGLADFLPDPRARKLRGPERLDGAAVPTVIVEFELAEGSRYQRLIQLRRHSTVYLEVACRPRPRASRAVAIDGIYVAGLIADSRPAE